MGKTTVIRETSRLLSQLHQKRVVIIDTSNEIGGDGDIAHIGIGRARRMQAGGPSPTSFGSAPSVGSFRIEESSQAEAGVPPATPADDCSL